MNQVVFLDSGPLGALCNVHGTPTTVACTRWLRELSDAGHLFVLPEIADYEVRRELVRLRRIKSLRRLDRLALQLEYLPLDTAAMRQAAEFWAQARQRGQPTASNDALDSDVILAGQAVSYNARNIVVATSNPSHITRFVPADLWQNIKP